MNDIRRNILWGVFLVSLFLLWDAWNRHTGQPSMFAPPPAKVAAAGSAPASGVPAAGLPQPAAAAATAGAQAAATPVAAASAAAPVASEKLTITTDVVKATLDGQGGSVVRMELLKHADGSQPKQPVLLFDHSAARAYEAQTGLITTQAGVSLPNHLTLMAVAPGERTLKDGANELAVRFESPVVGGVQLIKTYTFRRGQYTASVRHELKNSGTAAVNPQLYLQLVRDGNVEGNTNMFAGPVSFTGPAMYTEAGKYAKFEFKDIEKSVHDNKPLDMVRSADNGWVAMVQHYFASAWLVSDKAQREFRTNRVSNNLYSIAMVLPLGELAPGATKAHEAMLFAGPQEEKKLEALAPGLELVKDYGILTVLSKPLFWLLDQLHRVIGNWGWSIVALVFLLKIAFYWLNASAYRSMAKMKAINPKVMELRERYKDKPQQMQQEMMRIYREEKVNPLGGCLPIFVQMPFFIALYWVLLSSVEMRGAPWLGWIHDLSAIDPFYILPLLMTASTMFQTWLNPTPPDPVQAKMMWIMPLIFSVMFFFFPAGLVLYWLTNNILGIAQQWFINRQLGLNK
ncbi:MAG: membrane protein insertase YidC [Burkholderiaceae bacterium]|nr:membrane protein insertase YidC [Burkholderiaceae bacterium]